MRVGFTVPPLSKQKIAAAANIVRDRFSPLMSVNGYVPIDKVYEMLHLVLPEFNFEVCENDEMGGDHGQTFPEKQLIKLRSDVYDGMCSGSGRDRFTAAHELGHLFLHTQASFARATNSATPVYMNSEWQADTFASYLLIEQQALTVCKTIEEVQTRFGVSYSAAQVRFQK
jgi:Zn-dependent peptidase ImmA (M78 family)